MKKLTSAVLAVLMILSLCACGQGGAGSALTWQEQYDLGVRYLSEGNYQEAIIAFTAAIEIDPKQPDAYIGLADAYVGAGDPDAAKKALEDGLAACGEDVDLQTKLDALAAEGTPAWFSSTLELSNLSYRYVSGGLIEANPGAVGGMSLSCTVDGPSGVREVLIGSWQPSWTEEKITDTVNAMVAVWKTEGTPYAGNAPPFEVQSMHPVDPEELGTTQQVLLIGLDANGDAAGYALVTEQIPG